MKHLYIFYPIYIINDNNAKICDKNHTLFADGRKNSEKIFVLKQEF